jgi:hypothetical protein
MTPLTNNELDLVEGGNFPPPSAPPGPFPPSPQAPPAAPKLELNCYLLGNGEAECHIGPIPPAPPCTGNRCLI